MVNAGPGSGKTRVVTERAGMLVRKGVDPATIMLVTFTNKAAHEMRQRLGKIVGHREAGRIWCGTFHALCARILRGLPDDAHRENRKKDFSVYDESDSGALLKRAIEEQGLDPTVWVHTAIREVISRLKGEGVTAEEHVARSEEEEVGKRLWIDYEKQLVASNAFDFDDLLGVTTRLLEGPTEVARALRGRWKHVIVDEYQDTNEVQFRFAKALSQSGNICVVGDHRQGIYGFRGANARNILLFTERYPGAVVVDLDTNYRSDGNIVRCFNSLFEDSDMRAAEGRPGGERVQVLGCGHEGHEASSVCSRIFSMLDAGVAPSEIAVLYRVHALSRHIEERLRDQGVKYQVVGGLTFYERRVVKDFLSYLRLMVNPDSDVDVERVVNTPRRGVSDKTVARVRRCAVERRCSLYQAIPVAMGEVKAEKTRRGLLGFYYLVKHAREELASGMRLVDFVSRVLDVSGYRDFLQAEVRKHAASRKRVEEERAAQDLLNVEQVVNAVESYCERVKEPTLAGYLEEVALLTNQDELKDGAVSLMTIHAAKGLEYEAVFVVGVEEGLLPFARAITPEEVTEERRLFFVAVSRAKKHLVLSYADWRRLYQGDPVEKKPSRFLRVLPCDAIVGYGSFRKVADEMFQGEVGEVKGAAVEGLA